MASAVAENHTSPAVAGIDGRAPLGVRESTPPVVAGNQTGFFCQGCIGGNSPFTRLTIGKPKVFDINVSSSQPAAPKTTFKNANLALKDFRELTDPERKGEPNSDEVLASVDNYQDKSCRRCPV